MTTRRPTADEIRATAQRHVAGGWGKAPNQSIAWTNEDRRNYYLELDAAKFAAANPQPK